MSRRNNTIDAGYFDRLYTADEDPWSFRTSPYEQNKYADTLATLGRPFYAEALEVGCSIGVFTRMLAPHCARLRAMDGSSVALATARRLAPELPNVTFEERMIPDGFPSGSFDLIVLSEVVYYLVAPDVVRAAASCHAATGAGAEIILCHWLGETDYPLTGDAAGDTFAAALPAGRWTHQLIRRTDYRLDHFVKTTP